MFGPRDIALDTALPTIANSLAFVTLAEAKAFCGVTGSADDATLTNIINAACQEIEAWCGTILAQRTVTETLYPEDPITNLVLAHAPIISLTSVTIDDDAQDLTPYVALKASGIIRQKDGTHIGGTQIVVVYDAGYAELPEAIKQATLEFVRDKYLAKDRAGDITQETLSGVGGVTYGGSAVMSEPGPGGIVLPINVAGLVAPFAQRFAL